MILSIFDKGEPLCLQSMKNDRLISLGLPRSSYRDQEKIGKLISDVIETTRPEVVHSHHVFCDIYLAAILPRLGVSAIRSVLGITQTSWETGSNSEAITEWSPGTAQKIRETDSYFFATTVVCCDLKTRLISVGIPASKLHVVYPGVDQASPLQKDASRSQGSVDIGFFHRIENIKGIDIIPMLLSTLESRGIRARIHFPSIGKCLFQFRRVLCEGGGVGCFTEFDPSETVWNNAPRVDCMLLSSISEGLPLVILEAMARHVPVIAWRVGGVPEAVSHTHNGLLAEERTSLNFADAVELLLAMDDARRTLMVQNAFDNVGLVFDVKAYLKRIGCLYEQAILEGARNGKSRGTNSGI